MIAGIMPASWLGLAALALAARRSARARSLTTYALAFFGSAFVTRLAIEHHQSRSQIACFAFGTFVIEVVRARRSGRRFDLAFLVAALAASVVGVAAARPIAHRYGVSSW